MKRCLLVLAFLTNALGLALFTLAVDSVPLRQRLKETSFKIAHEAYLKDNWEILVMDADGEHSVNLTQTPTIHEHFPQVSPDGKKLCFVADEGEGRDAVRSLWVMDKLNHIYHIDWSPDSRFLSFSRGPNGHGDPSKPGTFGADYAAIMGVYAPGWNIAVVASDHKGKLDLEAASEADFAIITTNGFSNKEPAWFRPSRPGKE